MFRALIAGVAVVVGVVGGVAAVGAIGTEISHTHPVHVLAADDTPDDMHWPKN